jgi:methyl-accepting chemotaxis protein
MMKIVTMLSSTTCLNPQERIPMQLSNLSSTQKILLMLLIPTVSLGYFFSNLINGELNLARASNNYEQFYIVTLMTLLWVSLMLIVVIWVITYFQRTFHHLLTVTHALTKGQWQTALDAEGTDELNQLLLALEKLRAQLQDDKSSMSESQRLTHELKRVFAYLARGDLSHTVTGEYANSLEQLKTDVNNSIHYLKEAVIDIEQTAHATSQGDLNKRIEVRDKQGFIKELAICLNKNLDDNQQLLQELKRIFEAISTGDLTQSVKRHYAGTLEELKTDINKAMSKLQTDLGEINQVIEATNQGILEQRVVTNNKQGFLKELAVNLNNNLDLSKQLVDEVMRVFAAMAQGDLTQTMKQDYVGTLAQLKNDVNNSIAKLSDIMHEIREMVKAAGQGIFDQRMDLTNKIGFFQDISESLNKNLDTNQKMVEELMHVFSAMANGDLTQLMQDNYGGKLAELKDDVNSTVSKLKQLFEELIAVFSAMSSGNLTQSIHGNYTGRLAELKRDVIGTLTKLNQVMTEVGQTSDQVHRASEEIVQGSLSLSQRTEEQAAALEETSSSMQQMTDTVQRNSDNAQEANQLSIRARKHAEEGGKVVNLAVSSMIEINKSSRRMSDIISVIDEIAFQTNLLALNAAVEAARAGEQGRGFAVVATEVRNLAQRSATAAKEIKSLIQDNVGKIEEGTKLVNQSGQALDEIVSGIKKLSDIVAEIAAANREQSVGITQVNKSVLQMDEMTQQNAALVEELSTNSDAMREQISVLNEFLDFFEFEGKKQRRNAVEATKNNMANQSSTKTHTDSAGHSHSLTTHHFTPTNEPKSNQEHHALPIEHHRQQKEATWNDF